MKRRLILPIFILGILSTSSFCQHSFFIGSGLNTNFGYFENTDLVDSEPGLGIQIELNYEFQKENFFIGISPQVELINWTDQPDDFFVQPSLKSRILFFNLTSQVEYEFLKNTSIGAGGFYKRFLGKQRFLLTTDEWTKRNEHFTTNYDLGVLLSLTYRIDRFKIGFSYLHGFHDITNRLYDLENTGAIIGESLASYHRSIQFRLLFKL